MADFPNNNSNMAMATTVSAGTKRRIETASSSSSHPCGPFQRVCGGGGNSHHHHHIGKDDYSNKRPITNSDMLRAKEMNGLSVEEREAVYEDVHGISRVVKETPELIQQSLDKLEMELGRIWRKSAYDKAMFLSPTYVHRLRLLFLRAKGFQADEAAKQMVQYFEQKLLLFGPEKLVKLLTVDDLSTNDIEAMYEGCSAPGKDRSSRLVVISVSPTVTANHIRAFWYCTMSSLLEDEDAQRNGVVVVAYNMGPFRMEDMNKEAAKMGGNVMQALPMRVVGFHYCFDDPKMVPFVSLAKLVVGMGTRLRFENHFGSHTENKYELMRFGIPSDIIPVVHGGNIVGSGIKVYLKKRREREIYCPDFAPSTQSYLESVTTATAAAARTIDSPGPSDVLLGRGKPYQNFPGNLRWSEVIVEFLPHYQATTVGEKWIISDDVVRRVHGYGGRFLKRSKDGMSWEVVKDEIAREKTSKAFRVQLRHLSKAGVVGT